MGGFAVGYAQLDAYRTGSGIFAYVFIRIPLRLGFLFAIITGHRKLLNIFTDNRILGLRSESIRFILIIGKRRIRSPEHVLGGIPVPICFDFVYIVNDLRNTPLSFFPIGKCAWAANRRREK